jgi:hypothetical protein
MGMTVNSNQRQICLGPIYGAIEVNASDQALLCLN